MTGDGQGNGRERRVGQRFPLVCDVTLKYRENYFLSQTRDLSLGGISCDVEDAAAANGFVMGTQVEVEFQIPVQKEPILVSGTVRWRAGATIGIQFGGLRARDVWALQSWFAQQSARG